MVMKDELGSASVEVSTVASPTQCPHCGSPKMDERDRSRTWFSCGTHIYANDGLGGSTGRRNELCCEREEKNRAVLLSEELRRQRDEAIDALYGVRRELEAVTAKLESHAPEGHNVTNYQFFTLRTALDQWKKCAELLAELGQHPREGDEWIEDYVNLRGRAMGMFRELQGADKGS
jgi:hypothetical protein